MAKGDDLDKCVGPNPRNSGFLGQDFRSEAIIFFASGLSGLGDQFMLQGQGYGLDAAGDVQFGENIADVGLDGGAADYQTFGNFGVS